MHRRVASLLGLIALLVLLVPSLALAGTTAKRMLASDAPTITSRTSVTGVRTPLESQANAMSIEAFDSATHSVAKTGVSAAVDAAVPVTFDVSIYYWSGDWLRIEGVVTNNSPYPLTGVQVGSDVRTTGGALVAEDSTYISGYRMDPNESASFQMSFYLPSLVGADMDCSLDAAGFEDSSSGSISLTEVSRSLSTVGGMRVWSVVFRNDSPYTVESPVVGGWEVNADGLVDTLFDFQDTQIPPGGFVAMEAVGFYEYASPQTSFMYCDALPVATFMLTPSAGSHGSVSPNTPQTVDTGTSRSFAIVPTTGYRVADVRVDGVSVGAVTSYTFVDVRSNHQISATFAATSLPIAAVYAPVAPSSVTHSHAFTVYGYVAPRHTSGTYLATLKFYLRNSHGVYVFHNSVNAKRYYYSTTKSKYSARVSLPHAGRWRVRAMHGDAGHSTSYSGYDYITVK